MGAGDYLISITIDGKKFTRVLRVERVPGAPTTAPGGFGGGEPH
jgi:hypothetical protein